MGSGLPAPWAFVGLFTGFWKLVIVAALGLALYGRLGLPRHPLFRLLQPWSSVPPERRGKPKAEPVVWYRDRVFIFLVVVSAAAVAAWIVTKMTMIGAPGASH